MPGSRSRSPWIGRFAGLALVPSLCGLLAACGEGGVREIRDVRPRPADVPVARAMPAKDRLMGSSHPPMGREAAPGRMTWTYATPAGWTALPPSQFRDAGFRTPGDPGAECSLSTAGGDLAANVNRWRKQMGLPEIDEAAVAALPRSTLIGREAVLVELTGKYAGMQGRGGIDGAKMVGLIAPLPATSVFVKMVGPAAVVDAEMARFREFAASVKPGGPAAAAPEAPEDEPASPYRWTLPEGWVERPAKAMRVVTAAPASAKRTECYVSILSGTAGGYVANVNRWRGQMGLPDMTKEEIDALPRIEMLGAPGIYVELDGSLNDDMRNVQEDAALFYGAILERGDSSVFVKMTGPASEMRGEKERFQAFCRSLVEVR